MRGVMRFVPLMLLLGVPALAETQRIPDGAVVRIQTGESPRQTARALHSSTDSLWVRSGDTVRSLSLGSITHLELRERVTPLEHGWRWAKLGFVVGVLVGGVSCLADQENCRAETGAGESLGEGLLGA